MAKITKDNFERFLKDNKVVIIDFWADWCNPCLALGPILEKVSAKYPNIAFGKVNVDEEPGLATMFEVSSIPYVVKFVDGKIVDEFVGLRPESFVDEFYGK